MNASDRDRFVDELLDASLRRYRAEEPRAGLEARIVARVRVRQYSRRAAWLWTFSAAGAVLAVLVIVLALAHREAPPTVNRAANDRGSFPSTQAHGQPSADRGREVKPLASVAPAVSAAPKLSRRTPRPAAAAYRRPEQFPTPAPLSDEEKLLLAYASQLPTMALDKSDDKNLEIKPLEIPELQIARIKIEELPNLGE